MMRNPLQLIRSALFIAQMYAAMVLMGLVYAPLVLVRRDLAVTACRSYSRYVRWSAAWMVGLRSEIRGEVPTGPVLVAAKHQSFFDILILFSVLPQPRFVMKSELTRAPIFGWFALQAGCIPVERGKGGAAIKAMLARVADGTDAPGQLVIYPQGTRVAPGAHKPYKQGTAALYAQLGQPCVPAATNVGVFWPRHGLYRKPGVAVVEFLPAIPPGAPLRDFMSSIEQVIEINSNRLMAEAGHPPKA